MLRYSKAKNKRKPRWLPKEHAPRVNLWKFLHELNGSITDETFIRQPQVMTLKNVGA